MITTSGTLILISGILVLISAVVLLASWQKRIRHYSKRLEVQYLPSTPILFTHENADGWVIQDDLFCIYGIGDTFTEAAQDYIESGKSYYWHLREEPDSAKQRLLYIQNWDKMVRHLTLAIEARGEAGSDSGIRDEQP